MKLAMIVLFLIAAVLPLSANPEGIDCSIQLYDKRIYYLNDQNSPVQVQIQIVNNSPQIFQLKIADSRVFNIDFVVATPTNLRLDHSQKYTIAKNANQPVFFREISLQPGEKYGLVIDLADYIRIENPGLYVIQSLFYPQLLSQSEKDALHSNKLNLNVRPAVTLPEERAMIEVETGMLIQRESIPPDEVISYTLSARQKNQWEKFFLYMDLESLYRKNSLRERQYDRMSEEQRQAALLDFRKKLQGQTIDQDIILIPDRFEILKTTYTPSEATVLVTERFRYSDFTEIKRYTYYLVHRDRYWIIMNYEVQNMGTE